ncbi:acylneuraminate cytidylyltransferase family protein [Lactiplantibacillus pentosus]|jgi:CMP-N-acetylneuraminic acid synthetase|uniref:acylneuraminate cytidylyltransferase family protein n=1 Tax=Lactiplantibacillus pentosus TaxID=1589 RepID=UPI0002984A4A|nr:acylneuraminate cytidylyltransferase family protein [Lactiplantibacillus pentosus]EKP97068.1 N-acetylneuraminate cytidylyltransferase [Lacticaseibacillus casei 21/1]
MAKEDNLAVIPIRSGSKGLKDKNIFPLKGKPLVLYTVEALLQSNCILPENIYVASDSQAYLKLVNNSYPEVKAYLRSEQDSTDKSTTADFLKNFITSVGLGFKNLVLCQATSPLRTGEQIHAAFDMFEEKKPTSVVSVTKAEKTPRMLTTLDGGLMSDISGLDVGYRRQNEKLYYYPNGAIYITDIKSYMVESSFFKQDSMGFVMSAETSVDIDTLFDMRRAEALLDAQ